jgi:hypothetical protein
MVLQTNGIFLIGLLTTGIIILFFYCYFVYSNLKKLQNQIKYFYIRYLNKKAEELLYELHESFKELPDYFQWSCDVRDNFNRAIRGIFRNGTNMTEGIEQNHAQYGIYIVRSYFDALPSHVRFNDADKARIEKCFELIKSLQSKKNVTDVLCYIAREDSVFEQECKVCSNAIEDLHHFVY